MKKVGHTSEFIFGVYWWTWKTNYIRKTVEIILIFTMLHFLKNIKKSICRYRCQNLDDKIYSSWDIAQNILKLVILGHFLPFYPLKPQKSRFKKWKNLLEISSFFTCAPKNHKPCDAWFLRYWVRQTKFFVWIVVCPFTTLWTQKIKIFKN